MKKFVGLIGLGTGLALGSGFVWALYTSEAFRLIAVGVAAFLLATITIGGTALMVNRQWTNALGTQRTSHNHRYQMYPQPKPWESTLMSHQPDLLPPPGMSSMWEALETKNNVDDEVVA